MCSVSGRGEEEGEAVIKLRQQMYPHEDNHVALCTACTQNTHTTTSHMKLNVKVPTFYLSAVLGQREKESE